MGWWKKLKVWQKAGIIVGGTHLFIYFTVLLLAPPVAGYLSLILEKPWGWIFEAINFTVGGLIDFIILGIVGTFCYAISASVLVWAISLLKRKP